MESTINERIRYVISKLDYKSARAFSIKIGISPTSFNDIVNNNAEPKYSTLNKILQAEPSVSPEWLLTGEGEMLRGDTSTGDQLSTNVAGNINGGITGNKIQSGNINGNGNHVGIVPSDTERALVRAEWEVEHFKKEIKVLKEQLKQITANKEKEIENLKEQLKQAVIDKDRAMNMLDKALNKGS